MSHPSPADAQKLALGMAGMLTTVGILHFAAPKPFDTIVPAELPGSARFYTHASGVAELGTAALLAVPQTRRLGATVAMALFLAVFPANVNMVRLWWGKPWPMRLAALARLPFQFPMIKQAAAIRRNAPRP